MKLRPYPKYKFSDSAWLGEVPLDWNFTRHKFVSSFVKGRNPNELHDEQLTGCLPYLSMDYLRGQAEPKYVLSNESYCNVDANQTLLLWDGSNAGEFIKSKVGVVSSTIAFLKPSENVSEKYYWYYCKSVESEVRRSSIGMGIPHVNGDELKSLIFPKPSISEQNLIANFLGCETAKLDTLIAKQEKLIELLKEKRQAIISHAVTKGLDPNVKMKDSSVEWLGMVPEHWKVRRLKYNQYLLSEKTDRRYKSIGLENIEGWSGKFLDTDTEFEGEGVAFKVGDLLFGKLRPYLAKVYLAKFSGEAVGDFHVMRLTEQMSGKFALYQMLNRDFITIVDSSTYGAKMPRASWDFVGGMLVTCPPKNEQESIANYLDNTTTKIDILIDKAKSSIDLAKEHRTALISAAVTGKIDVRDIV